MPVRERGRFKAVGTIAALAAFLVAGLVLADLFVDASLRSVAVRLLAAVVLALAALRVRAVVKRRLDEQPSSSFELARRRAVTLDAEPSRLAQLESEIRAATRSQRFFDAVLWPDLLALAEGRTGTPAGWLARPPGRSFGRGPSRAALDRIVAEIEHRR
jgi:hypothetical protein